jgi:mono/diheme cytochrome c family protein
MRIDFSILPKWVMPTVVVLVCFSFIPLALAFLARTTNSPDPRMSLIPDMDNQARYKAQMAAPLFADGRAMRTPPAGTVARGQLHEDSHYYTGIVNNQWATTFPAQVEINEALLKRGQERYNINCSMCHGEDGYGQSIIDKRATNLMASGSANWTSPPSYHTDTIRNRPVGHIFNTITNGIRTMPPYGPQVSVADRWAIVAYVRALQISQHSSIAIVPADVRQELELRAQAEAPADSPAPAASAADPTPPAPAAGTEPAPPAEVTP